MGLFELYDLDSIASAKFKLLLIEVNIRGINIGMKFLILFIMFPFSNSNPLDFCESIILVASIINTGTNLTAVTNANTKSLGILIHFITISSSSGDVIRKNIEVDDMIVINLKDSCIANKIS